jgi:DHA2 family multidrug resistance protein
MTDAVASDVPAYDRVERASVQDWIAVFAGALGALMASLDISITNSALPQIQGEVGASGTEGTWIGTGYLVSEVVMIPLAAWFVRLMGLRRFLLIAALAFTAFSVLCGIADSLPAMIIGRVGQGFFGGALIPTAQTIIATRLPRKQMPLGMSMFGLIVLLGPLLGPVVGGYLTENVSWRWCFFLNLPVCVGLVTLLLLGLPKQKGNPGLIATADWLGIAGMTVGLSCLTVVLEEGQRERWFESSMIVWLSIASVVGFIALGIAQLRASDPVIKLSLLRNKSYASVIVIVLVVGAALYGTLYLIPQFLAGIAGYNAQQSGMVMLVSGAPAFLMMPILPQILGKFDLRLMVALGLMFFAASCFLDVGLTADSAGGDFTYSQLLRGCGQVLCMMPLNQASLAAVGRQNAGDASGIYNMARNLGGSIGLALFGMIIDRRATTHVDSITETLSANSIAGQEHVAATAAAMAQGGGDPAYAHMQALAQLSGEMQVQALVITYSECFWLLGMVMLAIIPLVFLLRKPAPGGPAAAAH